MDDEHRHGLDMNGEELKEAQQTDETLDGVRDSSVSRDNQRRRILWDRRDAVLERKSGWRRDGNSGATGVTQVLLAACVRVGTCYTISRTLGSSQDEAKVFAKIFLAQNGERLRCIL